MVVNADLIEVIEATPDTVITLIDGTRFVVREAPEVLVERIQQYRAALLSLRDDPVVGAVGSSTVPLALVPRPEDGVDAVGSTDAVDPDGSVGGV